MRIILSAVMAVSLAGMAAAQPDHNMMMPGMGGGMGGGGMMGGGMGGGHGAGQMCHIVGSGHHMEGTLAFLKTELKITGAQSSAWDAFAAAFRVARPDAHGEKKHEGKMQRKEHAPLTDRMAHHEKMMEAHLEQMKKMHAVMGALYSSLNSEQKRMADELLPAFMMCRMHG